MRRSLQEYVELVVFGLVALLVGTGLLWLVGWVLSIGGIALKWVAGLLWNLLRFIVPVAIAGGLVYFLVKAAQDRQPKPTTADAAAGNAAGGTAGSAMPSTAGPNPPTSGATAASPQAATGAAQVSPTTASSASDGQAAAEERADAVSDVAQPVEPEEDDERA